MGVPVKVWLGGEGSNELGGRAYDPPGDQAGVIEALLRKIEPTGWRVAGATKWCDIPKFRTGVRDGEERSVLGLVQTAWEERAEVVAFTRDTEGEDDRQKRIERAVDAAKTHFAALSYREQPIAIIGGPACPAIEGWVLALNGERDTDDMSKARTHAKLAERAIDGKQTEAYVAAVDSADLAAELPPGCRSLRRWLEEARAVLREAVHGVAKSNG